MEAMILHLGTTSIAETLVRLIGADETPSGGPSSSQQLLWLERTDIMSSLLFRYVSEWHPDHAGNVNVLLPACMSSCLLAYHGHSAGLLRHSKLHGSENQQSFIQQVWALISGVLNNPLDHG